MFIWRWILLSWWSHLTSISPQVTDPEVEFLQRRICVISEMFHTSSLYHDDVIDKALTRRGKASVNSRWNQKSSIFAGDFILGISSAILARTNNPEAGNDDNLRVSSLLFSCRWLRACSKSWMISFWESFSKWWPSRPLLLQRSLIWSQLPKKRQGGQILSVFGEKLQQDCQHYCQLLQVCCSSLCRQHRQYRGRKTDFGETIFIKCHKMSYSILFQILFRRSLPFSTVRILESPSNWLMIYWISPQLETFWVRRVETGWDV